MESFKGFAEVVFGIPVDMGFLYKIPEKMVPLCKKGVRVFAPFGRRNMIGYVTGFQDKTDIETKELIEIIDTEPVITEDIFKFTRWIADYYFCSWGEVIESAMPRWVDVKIVNKKEIKRVKKLKSSRVRELTPQLLNSSTPQLINSLTPHQESALRKIQGKIDDGKHHVFLLHGITGSGKTEIYIRSAAESIKRGRKVIVMVPEITLTLQLFQRFLRFFGGRVAMLHSGLTPREKYDEWLRIRSGEADIVIGARSSVFAPLKNTGLIIVDEEHDNAYKQDEIPRYNGRDMAVVRGRLSDAVVILGSATPSMESFYNSRIGKYEYISLPERVYKKPLPEIEVVDIKKEDRKNGIISERLKMEIGKRITKREQVMLFLNRRGTAGYIHCMECGFVWKCRNCSVSLTYHKKRNLGICHYCEYSTAISDTCPECKGHHIDYKGIGTQRLEDEVKALFPDSNVERMDRDTVKRRGEAGRILKGMEGGNVNILIGTQMIAKGHDYPGITLVGIVSADESLNIPDFRAAERTFQLITQVAGRTGRGDIKGDVILQTYNADHYAIECAMGHDFIQFYNQEGKFREALNYPPYAKMVSFILTGRNEKKVEVFSRNLGKILDKLIGGYKDVEKLGPSKAIIYKVKNRYRWHIILKSKRVDSIRNITSMAIKDINSSPVPKGGVKVSVDVDPVFII